MRRSDRGITFVTVLLLVGAAAAVVWFITYGQADWENLEVKRVLREAANVSYRQDDGAVRTFVFRELHHLFDQKVEDHGRVVTEMRIERTQIPPAVHIWLSYSRDVEVPVIKQQRRITFTEYAEQDLSPVKW